ncbi:uncharacterized protein LOC106086690 [Stomoxys calcitrans]|uniref:uncharacterized protein LOC106086690 n=1 Tax=Stomoxys calcitrans TaxID=35570 RepID=UPI0027E3A30D|nr:uncharacterized protein LOC106086690 [Stomoxys calcitrans]
MSKIGAVWSREKINQLIELYKKNECLWNHWHESYKNKEKRNRAIKEICIALRITKFDFGKKIHNLRNQFNTEMKKWEQRMEEAGGVPDNVDGNTAIRCKWIHFESLMFLRNVIEPRPGGYQSTALHQPPKKMRLKFDYNSAEDDVNITMLSAPNASSNEDISSNYQYEEQTEETSPAEVCQNFENELNAVVNDQAMPREDSLDQKYIPPPVQQMQQQQLQMPTNKSYSQKKATLSAANNSIHISPGYAEIVNLSSHDNAAAIEINAHDMAVVTSHNQALMPSSTTSTSSVPTSTAAASVIETPVIASVVCGSSNVSTSLSQSPLAPRDQWDSFGELVATELRNLNSDLSRKKLKRKIMQAMLEVGEQDDAL